jgi:hypothetical protein
VRIGGIEDKRAGVEGLDVAKSLDARLSNPQIL